MPTKTQTMLASISSIVHRVGKLTQNHPTRRHQIMSDAHFIIVTLPAQGHLNPCLQLAKRLIRMDVQVTFLISVHVLRQISKNDFQIPDGFKFATYSDGYDEGRKPGSDMNRFFSETRSNSSQRLREIIATSSEEGCPVTCLVYNFLLPWAAKVARECHICSSVLWIQPATVLDIYHYYFNGYKNVMLEKYEDPSWSIELPGLPLLHACDLPSLLFPSTSNEYHRALPLIEEMILELNDSKAKILVNTFDALEPEALKVIEKYNCIAIGPLVPSAFLDRKDPLDTSLVCDLFQKANDYTEWLNEKPKSSVVYVSFGSLLSLPKPQMEEIARGLLEIHRPFLWVIKAKEDGEEERLSCMEELQQEGKIVPWCSQLEILSHPSLGCFVTHCGWSSTLESLASGIPVVAFPHLSDQMTNAKLMVDEWKIAVRVRADGEGIVRSDEVKRCVEMAMGDEQIGEEMRRNAQKWKNLAREAVKEGGSSDENLKAFVGEVGGDN